RGRPGAGAGRQRGDGPDRRRDHAPASRARHRLTPGPRRAHRPAGGRAGGIRGPPFGRPRTLTTMDSRGALGVDMTELATTELTARLHRAPGRLARMLRREVPSALGPGAMAALSTLVNEGPMRPTDLAAREGVRPPTLTRMLTVLEEGGYVERTGDPADRRASLVAPTPPGRQTVLDPRSARTGLLARH